MRLPRQKNMSSYAPCCKYLSTKKNKREREENRHLGRLQEIACLVHVVSLYFPFNLCRFFIVMKIGFVKKNEKKKKRMLCNIHSLIQYYTYLCSTGTVVRHKAYQATTIVKLTRELEFFFVVLVGFPGHCPRVTFTYVYTQPVHPTLVTSQLSS